MVMVIPETEVSDELTHADMKPGDRYFFTNGSPDAIEGVLCYRDNEGMYRASRKSTPVHKKPCPASLRQSVVLAKTTTITIGWHSMDAGRKMYCADTNLEMMSYKCRFVGPGQILRITIKCSDGSEREVGSEFKVITSPRPEVG